ncbi:hypothetical protein Taro_016238 [Colocasia esculenta]|uniref:Uncharacterized protein n=1 Tax=Colocasia esculenta TaxID=4460 RepID=A0A843USD3_COLES|nr:hypothetical protein [Colocasia esculenta]
MKEINKHNHQNPKNTEDRLRPTSVGMQGKSVGIPGELVCREKWEEEPRKQNQEEIIIKLRGRHSRQGEGGRPKCWGRAGEPRSILIIYNTAYISTLSWYSGNCSAYFAFQPSTAHFLGAAGAGFDVGAGAHLVAAATVLGLLRRCDPPPSCPSQPRSGVAEMLGKRGWTGGGCEEYNAEGEEGGGGGRHGAAGGGGRHGSGMFNYRSQDKSRKVLGRT